MSADTSGAEQRERTEEKDGGRGGLRIRERSVGLDESLDSCVRGHEVIHPAREHADRQSNQLRESGTQD